ncbi:hypothetical protein U1Q18_024481 [Sarracenia purpurea var. burkii]
MPDNVVEDASANSGQEEGNFKKELERKVSPLSTLESSFEALNVKKFDVAFAVDPLYHQTSAQFDEGGAKGLLLNNLGIYGSCRVLFDSLEVPGKFVSSSNPHDKLETIDVSFAKEYIERMVLHMQTKDEISPTLRDIVNRFDENNRRPSCMFSSGQKPAEEVYEDCNNSYNVELDGDAFDNCGTWAFDHDDQASVVGDDSYGGDPSLPSYHQENDRSDFHEPDMDGRFEKVDGYLFLSLGFTSKQNAWAGPDHWKYRKAKGSENPAPRNGSPLITKKTRNKRQADVEIDFTKAFDNEMSDVFAPPKNSKSLLLPANRAPCNTTLPEDCHYQPENLVKLFLLPNAMCLGRRGKKSSEEWNQQRDDYGSLPTWDGDNVFAGQYSDGDVYSDVEDTNTLVSQPRQVSKVDVHYDKASKQVDVQALKETLWDHILDFAQMFVQSKYLTVEHIFYGKGQEETVSFKHVLADFPTDCRAAASLRDISPHLCFICVLHLANEHGLSLRGCANLDDLSIHVPPLKDKTSTVTI